MMRLLANENFPRIIVDALRADGHDVAWVWEDSRGAPDEEILARAQLESRIIATFEKGFGELAFRSGRPASCGVLLLRVAGSPEVQLRLTREALTNHPQCAGLFTVVTNDNVRVRALPGSAHPP